MYNFSIVPIFAIFATIFSFLISGGIIAVTVVIIVKAVKRNKKITAHQDKIIFAGPKVCEYCNTENKPNATKCSNCGAALPSESETKKQ